MSRRSAKVRDSRRTMSEVRSRASCWARETRRRSVSGEWTTSASVNQKNSGKAALALNGEFSGDVATVAQAGLPALHEAMPALRAQSLPVQPGSRWGAEITWTLEAALDSVAALRASSAVASSL